MPLRLMSAVGIIAFIFCAWLLSSQRRQFPLRIVVWGLALQLLLAVFALNIPIGITILDAISQGFTTFLGYSRAGSQFLFGNIVKPEYLNTFGFQVALTIVPTIIFFSAFISLLYHLGIMQRIVYAMAWCMSKTMGTSGPESLSAAANIFIGQTEAPIIIREYLSHSTMSELQAIMAGGFATIASSVMGAYISFGIPAKFLLVASILAAPGSLYLSKIVLPPQGDELTFRQLSPRTQRTSANVLEATTNGARDGLMLSLNVVAMLLAFVSLVAVCDAAFGYVHSYVAWFPSSLKELLGYIFHPFAYLVGIDGSEAHIFASLFGAKISLNEFIAYADLSSLMKAGAVSERTIAISTFALCGFANISSIAIQIGGIGALAPDRRSDLARLGWKAMAVGALTNLLGAAIAGLLL